MQRYHLTAPARVEFGNRVEVAVEGCGKLLVKWPLLAIENAPIQIHLPVVNLHNKPALCLRLRLFFNHGRTPSVTAPGFVQLFFVRLSTTALTFRTHTRTGLLGRNIFKNNRSSG